MKKIIKVLCPTFITLLLCVQSGMSGQIKELFDSPKLDSNLWRIEAAGKASHKIENGKLILISEAVTDGIAIYYTKMITKEDMTIEVIANPSLIKDAGVIGFTDKIITPTLNTDVNPRFRNSFMGVKPTGCYLFDDNGKAYLDLKADYKPDYHKYEIQLLGDKVIFSIDGQEIGTLKRESPERYFIISPDPYTSHYAGSIEIDSIRLIGSALSVINKEDRIAIAWGKVKTGEQVHVERW